MPSWFVESNVIRPSDDPMRSLAKWCQLLYDGIGDRPAPYPEGCKPMPSDDEERLTRKINILQNG